MRILVVVAALALLACGERYKYTEGRNGLVRTDRVTGRAEVLVRTPTGDPVWRPIETQAERAAATSAPRVAPVARPIEGSVAANEPGLRVEAAVLGGFRDPLDDVLDGPGAPLTVSVQNGTKYDLSRVRIQLQYRVDKNTALNTVETVGPIQRGESDTYRLPLTRGATFVGWAVVGATGTAIQ